MSEVLDKTIPDSLNKPLPGTLAPLLSNHKKEVDDKLDKKFGELNQAMEQLSRRFDEAEVLQTEAPGTPKAKNKTQRPRSETQRETCKVGIQSFDCL